MGPEGQKDSATGRAIALQQFDLGYIPGTSYVSPAPLDAKSDLLAQNKHRSKPWAQSGVTSKSK